MTQLLHHPWLRHALAVFAIAALLVTSGTQMASAKPVQQTSERDLDKAMCDMMGGDWWEDGANYTCYFDDWYLVCENGGADCEIFCDLGKRCERIVEDTRHQTSLANDQQVLAVEPTPTPQGGRTTIADDQNVFATEPSPTPIPRGRGR